jgi:hypothetical protein
MRRLRLVLVTCLIGVALLCAAALALAVSPFGSSPRQGPDATASAGATSAKSRPRRTRSPKSPIRSGVATRC